MLRTALSVLRVLTFRKEGTLRKKQKGRAFQLHGKQEQEEEERKTEGMRQILAPPQGLLRCLEKKACIP